MLSRANPNVVLVVALVAFLGVIGGLLGLYLLAPQRPNVQPLFAAIPGSLAFLVSLLVSKRQSSHGEQLTTIEKNTNGVLTQRVTDTVNSAVPVAVATALASQLNGAEPLPTPRQPAPPAEPAEELAPPADGGTP